MRRKNSFGGREGRGAPKRGRGREHDIQPIGENVNYTDLLEKPDEKKEQTTLEILADRTMTARVKFECDEQTGGKPKTYLDKNTGEPIVTFQLTAKNFSAVQLTVDGKTTKPIAFMAAPGERSTGSPSRHAERYAVADAINQAIDLGWAPQYQGITLGEKDKLFPPFKHEELSKFTEGLQDASITLFTEKSFCTTPQNKLPAGEKNCSTVLPDILFGKDHKIYYAVDGNNNDAGLKEARKKYYQNNDYANQKKYFARNQSEVEKLKNTQKSATKIKESKASPETTNTASDTTKITTSTKITIATPIVTTTTKSTKSEQKPPFMTSLTSLHSTTEDKKKKQSGEQFVEEQTVAKRQKTQSSKQTTQKKQTFSATSSNQGEGVKYGGVEGFNFASSSEPPIILQVTTMTTANTTQPHATAKKQSEEIRHGRENKNKQSGSILHTTKTNTAPKSTKGNLSKEETAPNEQLQGQKRPGEQFVEEQTVAKRQKTQSSKQATQKKQTFSATSSNQGEGVKYGGVKGFSFASSPEPTTTSQVARHSATQQEAFLSQVQNQNANTSGKMKKLEKKGSNPSQEKKF